MKNFENPIFLKNKYDLHKSPEVDSTVKRIEKQTGEKISQDPGVRIQKYLDRLEKLVIDPDKKQDRKTFGKDSRPRALSLLREMIMNEYVRPNKEKMAEGAAAVEERAARNIGMEVHYGEEELEQRGEIAVTDLEKSLDNWIAYLSDANEPYPTWFRYYAFRNILNLGDYDKDKKEFSKRSKGSTRLFPEIDRGALAYVQEKIEASENPQMLEKIRRAQKMAANNDIPESELLNQKKAEDFSKLSFAKQYAEGLAQAGEITPELREITKGKWIKYQKGTDPTALWASLQNKGTAWCTKGFATAETQLQGGDFYVYYTLDRQGKPTIPRIAIRMQDGNIGEVRGVADGDQNLEGNMADIAQAKLDEFPDGKSYKKKSDDMKRLTEIEKKTQSGQDLSKNDLIFLYEIDFSIQGFGYQKDPRIKEIRKNRNIENDIRELYAFDLENPDKTALEFIYDIGNRQMPPAFLDHVKNLRKNRNVDEDMFGIFECEPNQIAYNHNEITESTKAYIGEWNMEIFQKIKKHPNIEHLFESFPDKKIFMKTLEKDPNIASLKTAEEALVKKNMYLSDYGKDILQKTEFSKEKQSYDLVRFTVTQLGFPNGATTDEIYKKAEELGLELCPDEVGPHLRLQYPGKEWMLIAMKQITGRDGDPDVFNLRSDDDGLKLNGFDAKPGGRWDDNNQFVFRFRKAL